MTHNHGHISCTELNLVVFNTNGLMVMLYTRPAAAARSCCAANLTCHHYTLTITNATGKLLEENIVVAAGILQQFDTSKYEMGSYCISLYNACGQLVQAKKFVRN